MPKYGMIIHGTDEESYAAAERKIDECIEEYGHQGVLETGIAPTHNGLMAWVITNG